MAGRDTPPAPDRRCPRDPLRSRHGSDPFEPLLQRVTRVPTSAADEEDQREAAELLHALGTAEALARLADGPGHARARALLRDARWDAPGAGDVPILGAPASAEAAWQLVTLRLRRAARIAASRWAGAALGGGVAGALGGSLGGVLLATAPAGTASPAVIPVLAVVGGRLRRGRGAGVGAGLSVAEAAFRSRRTIALVGGGALAAAWSALAAQWLSRWTLAALVGVHLDLGGGPSKVSRLAPRPGWATPAHGPAEGGWRRRAAGAVPRPQRWWGSRAPRRPWRWP